LSSLAANKDGQSRSVIFSLLLYRLPGDWDNEYKNAQTISYGENLLALITRDWVKSMVRSTNGVTALCRQRLAVAN
jgi:hypothetical protein